MCYFMHNQIGKKFAHGTVPCLFQDCPTLADVLDDLQIGSLWFLTITCPKEVLARKKWIQNYMGACFQAPRAAPGQRLMEMHHVH